MFLVSFRHLIEIEALKKENQTNLARIASENKRIYDLEERRKKTLVLNENLTLEDKNLKLTESQNKIEDMQLRLSKLTSQLSLSVTEKEQIAFENQIKLIKEEIEKLEMQYFEALEKSEEYLTLIQENNEFMKGSLTTLEDIKNDVLENIQKEEDFITNRNKRIQALIEQCHPSLTTLYLDLEKRFSPKSAVSFLIAKKCTACHMQVDAILSQSLDEGRSLETCPSCSRLLIPDSSRIYYVEIIHPMAKYALFG
jgi:predicted  nucleic acid-binding Zn-ribbon protein